MKVVILAAGIGSRLGDPNLPKPLTQLANGLSILEFQLKNLSKNISREDVMIIVGFHKEEIMTRFPDLTFVQNPRFAEENTGKSLLRALENLNEDVLWINGDVVFHPSIPGRLMSLGKSCMLVNQGLVGEEEVKYRTDGSGKILEVSKQVSNPEGEALGLNFFKAQDLPLFIQGLRACSDRDYFEYGIEEAIKRGLAVWTVPVPSHFCTEIDFPEDLKKANQLIFNW